MDRNFLGGTVDSRKECLFAVTSNNKNTRARGSKIIIIIIASIGLRLSDVAVRLAVAQGLGCKAYEPHTCICGIMPVDARGLHVGLSCRKSSPRQQ